MKNEEPDLEPEFELFLDWVQGSLSYEHSVFSEVFDEVEGPPSDELSLMNNGLLALALASIAHEHELAEDAKEILAFCCASLLSHESSQFSMSVSKNGSGRRPDLKQAFMRAVFDYEVATYLKKRAPIDGTESVVADLCARFNCSRSEVFKGVSRAKNWKGLSAAMIYEKISEGYSEI